MGLYKYFNRIDENEVCNEVETNGGNTDMEINHQSGDGKLRKFNYVGLSYIRNVTEKINRNSIWSWF